jgi:hypothetical protein
MQLGIDGLHAKLLLFDQRPNCACAIAKHKRRALALHTADQYAKGADRIEKEGKPDAEWAAFKRMLNRSDPDYAG